MVKLLTGSYLKVAELRGGEIITFLNEGSWVEKDKFQRPDGKPAVRFEMEVKLGDYTKIMGVNKMSRDAVAKVYGSETSAWVGKQAKVELMDALVGGKKMKVVQLHPVKDASEVGWDDAK